MQGCVCLFVCVSNPLALVSQCLRSLLVLLVVEVEVGVRHRSRHGGEVVKAWCDC